MDTSDETLKTLELLDARAEKAEKKLAYVRKKVEVIIDFAEGHLEIANRDNMIRAAQSWRTQKITAQKILDLIDAEQKPLEEK